MVACVGRYIAQDQVGSSQLSAVVHEYFRVKDKVKLPNTHYVYIRPKFLGNYSRERVYELVRHWEKKNDDENETYVYKIDKEITDKVQKKGEGNTI